MSGTADSLKDQLDAERETTASLFVEVTSLTAESEDYKARLVDADTACARLAFALESQALASALESQALKTSRSECKVCCGPGKVAYLLPRPSQQQRAEPLAPGSQATLEHTAAELIASNQAIERVTANAHAAEQRYDFTPFMLLPCSGIFFLLDCAFEGREGLLD